MQKKRPQHTLTVLKKDPLSPDMLRIWFSFDSAGLYQTAHEGDYLKLVFLSEQGDSYLRTYTVAKVNESAQLVAIDFVIHNQHSELPDSINGGFAHHFAQTATAGSQLNAIGPNNKSSLLSAYQNTLFIADATALPALAALLRQNDASGTVILYNCGQPLAEFYITQKMTLHAVPSLEALTQLLENHQTNIDSLWCAGEFNMMRRVRAYAKDKLTLNRGNQYFSSYWKQGITEDGHKVLKRADTLAEK